MGAKRKPGQRPRVALTREAVLDAAIALADARGIGALSMRSIARELGVEAMSLYNHVPNKDAILDGIVDRVFSLVPPLEGDDWKEAIRARARASRALFREHHWVVPLLDSRSNPGPATLAHHESTIACLRAAGFSFPLVAHALASIDSYLFGFVIQEISLPFESSSELDDVLDGILAPGFASHYPHLAEFIAQHVMQPGYDHAREFEWGLDLVLDGLERASLQG